MGRNKSPLQQTLILFKHADAIGESRTPAKEDGTASWKIFHSTTFKEYVGNFARVLEYARDNYEVRQIKDLKQEHVTAFINSLNQRQLADSTIQKYVATINKADSIAKYIGWRNENDSPWIREEPKGPKLMILPHPFSSEDADKIIGTLKNFRDQRFSALAQVQRGAGLRVNEAVCLRVSAVSPDGSKLMLIAADGTKKGRPREVVVTDPKTREVLSHWREVAENSGRHRMFIIKVKDAGRLTRSYQRAIQSAASQLKVTHCKTHDLRRTFAMERYYDYLKLGFSRAEALSQLSEDLGHGRSRMERGLLLSYLNFDIS